MCVGVRAECRLKLGKSSRRHATVNMHEYRVRRQMRDKPSNLQGLSVSQKYICNRHESSLNTSLSFHRNRPAFVGTYFTRLAHLMATGSKYLVEI